MALTFLAAQSVSPRHHNEVLTDSHRPRLKTSPSFPDETVGQQKQLQPPIIPDQQEDTYSTDDDEHLNEHKQPCNNNDEQLYDFNNKPDYRLAGIPVGDFPPSLIKWPLDNNPRRRRLADIRNQVKQLTSVIKMTIDNDHEGGAQRMNPVPFSSVVNMASISEPAGAAAPGDLPSMEDLNAHIAAQRTKELKTLVRNSCWLLNDPIREQMWKVFCQNLTTEQFTDIYYWDTVQQMFGTRDVSKIEKCQIVLPTFVDEKRLVSYSLSEDGVKAVERVVMVINFSCPDITFAPLIYPLTALFMHYMEEPDTFNCISALLTKGSHFISQTLTLAESSWRAVENLSKKHIRGSYMMLEKFGVTDVQTSEGFQQWLWWMFAYLPLSHLVRVVDCLLFEGNKILIRNSMSIFHLYMKKVSKDTDMAAVITTKGFSEAIKSFLQDCPFSAQKLLKNGFGIRALAKSDIKKVLIRYESSVKNAQLPGPLTHSNSLEGLPTSGSQEDLQKDSHTFAIKEGGPSQPRYNVPPVKSSAFDHMELLTIWGWLPMRMTMLHPTLIYTTEEHGSSLTTFYNRADKHEPTLLIVRTIDDQVFGAYCSTAWGVRKQQDEHGNRQTYFGTGETFLFSLRPKCVKYEWVGITKQKKDAQLSSLSHSEQLFMHADTDMISVGGGEGHGLMIDKEFQTGKSERCETYDNPPLCPGGNFDIKVVEVYGLVAP